jgi:UDP-N-acetylmuramoyl-tripeptide--D-alanyl-D-alanine ligase
MRFEINEILSSTKGQLLSKHLSQFEAVGTDSRQNISQKIFFALKGDSFDAHDFLDKAVQANAALLIVHDLNKVTEGIKNQVSVILVKDTLKALQDLAHYERHKRKFKVLSMTGSNGKTTTKEFTYQIISPYLKTFSNQGSFNNHWGVPITLLNTPEDSEVTIVEMGMNHYNEINSLVQIANPDVVTCTMVGRAHIENFGSIENIAKAKYEIYESSSRDVYRLFNIDQKETRKMLDLERNRFSEGFKFLTYSQLDSKADIFLKLDQISFLGLEISGHIQNSPIQAQVPIFGMQNMTNILAACAFATSVGLTPLQIQAQLNKLETNWGRNQILKTTNEITIIFDAYNANPDSFQALLDNVKLVKNQGQKIAIFGQMRELGQHSNQLHYELGAATGKEGFDLVFFLGEDEDAFCKGLKDLTTNKIKYEKNKNLFTSSSDVNALKTILLNLAKPHDALFVKASRGTALERILKDFKFIGESPV